MPEDAEWGYDTNTNDRRLISITNSGITRSYTLGYGAGPVNPYDIMSVTDTAASGHPWATQSRSYTYDQSDRLLTATATTPGNDTYVYDLLDNATTITTPSGTTNPTYNVLNQLATFGTKTYSYDANGNTTGGDGAKTYKYDAENRLIEIDYTGTSNKSVFAYDGLGHRISDAETVSGTTTTTYYLWCGSSICQTRNSSQTAIRRDFTEGEFNASTTQKLVYMPDQLGSVRDVLDASTGTRVASYDYSPYGAITQSNITNGTDYQFARMFFHAPSGLNLSTNRAFDPITGRFINRDPIRETGGINPYAYAFASPIRGIDPWGLYTAIIVGGPTAGNPFGHVGFATTGGGVYSYGTSEPFGSSTTDYLALQSMYRDQTVFILDTTQEQENNMIVAMSAYAGTPYSIKNNHDCATAVLSALEAAGGLDMSYLNDAILPIIDPSVPATIAQYQPILTQTYFIPAGGPIPQPLKRFNPIQQLGR